MKNITYLFGAGASKGALPIVNEITDRIGNLIVRLTQFPRTHLMGILNEETINGEKHDLSVSLDKIIEDLEWLKRESDNHASIDTYAKKLLINKEYKSLHKLKVALSLFFTIEQVINKPDDRYDFFYAALYDESYHYNFPSHIKILSWNYDNQFEISFSNFKNEAKDLSSIRRGLNMTTKFERVRDIKNWQIIQINGYTSFSELSRIDMSTYGEIIGQEFETPLLRQIIINYIKASNQKQYVSNLSFAWESFDADSKFDIVENAKISTVNTEVLVVIGYSFPFFNRKIDREIIGNMKNLKKVYFQAPERFSKDNKERFEAIRTDIPKENLIEINNLNQFHIPNEL
ncbi:hypothetical protein [Flagellimonas profundi]|uniref:SIR2-like domain-containing protein n=1 Tax=Flagellimonas profundi TaxID=2915620 RepID=A0ABS3FKA9_9FLAO|nr:hypothetical protein [Allomuricauda profundi]MBO0343581.1 hypothetical protein [Allomuricauda profundi]